jgi:hypothetical protein
MTTHTATHPARVLAVISLVFRMLTMSAQAVASELPQIPADASAAAAPVIHQVMPAQKLQDAFDLAYQDGGPFGACNPSFPTHPGECNSTFPKAKGREIAAAG